ncbi:MAG: lactate permease [Anaerolineaceae bacterium]|nr:lactate permease [Anaerolineaceae bacterium]
MSLTFLNWFLAFLPVLTVLILMLGFKWGGSKAGAFSWFVTILTAVFVFGAGAKLIAYSQVKATILSIDVILVIWMALLLFHVSNEAGAIQMIGNALTSLTPDRTMQGLLIGWVFVSFLQGMGGFGVPVAVTAPLLVGMGFSPITAVVIASIGHGWAVNYGSLATSFQTLMAVTNLPGEFLAPESSLLLGIGCFVSGIIVALVAGGWKGLLRGLPAILIIGSVMSLTQYFLSVTGIWTLGATGGAMAGLAVGIPLTRLPLYQHGAQKTKALPIKPKSLIFAVSAYLILVILAFSINLITPLKTFLSDLLQLKLYFPELQTSLGWVTPAEYGRVIKLLSHPGAILLYSSIIAFFIYKRAGFYPPQAAKQIGEKVLKGAINSSLGILAMVGLAVLMSHSGMTNLLAQGLGRAFGARAYPFLSTYIGALGAFITGSNNNSNVLFAILQMNTAELLGLSVPLILGAQTAGGSIGSIMAPAKIIVGCSTVGLGDEEGTVMGKVITLAIIPITVIAIFVFLIS